MPTNSEKDTLVHIKSALNHASALSKGFARTKVAVEYKGECDPVTEADRALNEMLREFLVQDGDGWFSEESVDDQSRCKRQRLWVVDPIDGTKEFVQGIPEWCVSIALVFRGEAVAGGICNPITGEMFLGSRQTGVTYNDLPVQVSTRTSLSGAKVLASRTEINAGYWECYSGTDIQLRPVGSVAYKLALVAAGIADATWTPVPKHEWDVAAGVALVQSAGGIVRTLEGAPLTLNKPVPLLSGLIACGPGLYEHIRSLIDNQACLNKRCER